MREAAIQEFFAEGNFVPLTIVYEDFIQEYEKTVRTVLEFLGLDPLNTQLPPPWHGRLTIFQKNGSNDFVKSFKPAGNIEDGNGRKIQNRFS